MGQPNKKKKVTSAKGWKKGNAGSGDAAVELELPSGNVCLARAPGIQTFIQEGLFPNSLLKVVQETLLSGETELDTEKIMSSVVGDRNDMESMLKTMTEMADKVTVFCVVEPRVMPAQVADDSTPGGLRTLSMAERDPEMLYVDDVDLQDKLYIFNWAVGGPAQLEKFRTGPEADVDAVQPGEAVVDSAE